MTELGDFFTVKEVDKIDKRVINYYCATSIDQAKRRAKKVGGTITNDEEEKKRILKKMAKE